MDLRDTSKSDQTAEEKDSGSRFKETDNDHHYIPYTYNVLYMVNIMFAPLYGMAL